MNALSAAREDAKTSNRIIYVFARKKENGELVVEKRLIVGLLFDWRSFLVVDKKLNKRWRFVGEYKISYLSIN